MIKRVFRQMLSAQIISSMTVMLCMLVDSIMIGRFLGVDSMTAYGLATPVLLVFAPGSTPLADIMPTVRLLRPRHPTVYFFAE